MHYAIVSRIRLARALQDRGEVEAKTMHDLRKLVEPRQEVALKTAEFVVLQSAFEAMMLEITKLEFQGGQQADPKNRSSGFD